MNVESLRWWHWMIVGAVAGLAAGFGRVQTGLQRPLGGEDFISQAAFERELRLPPIMGRPYLAGIAIHPWRDVDLISLSELDPETLRYRDRWFAAQRPYHPLNSDAEPAAGYRVRDHLSEMAAARPDMSFRFAWWDSPRAVLLGWMLIGMAVLGGVWPPLLLLLIGAGWGRKPGDEAYDLDRFHHGADAKAEQRDLSDEDRRRLEELEAEMMAGVSGTPAHAPTAPAQPEPAVQVLAGGVVESAPAASAEQKDFGGEYYPVEKKAPHGFSLVELLVVIGIIAVLIALLMPTIVTAQRHAQATQCASNLRQLGMALQSYANANHGWLPAWSGWHTWPANTSDDSTGPAWTVELMPFIGRPDSQIYNCPSFPSRVKCRNYFLAAQWSGKTGKHAMKLTDVTMTGRFVLSGDKTQRGLYPPPFGSSEHLLDDADPDDNGSGMPVLAWPWDPGGFYMHQGGNNVLFDDIHVALFSGYDKYSMTFNPHRMEKWADVTPD